MYVCLIVLFNKYKNNILICFINTLDIKQDEKKQQMIIFCMGLFFYSKIILKNTNKIK